MSLDHSSHISACTPDKLQRQLVIVILYCQLMMGTSQRAQNSTVDLHYSYVPRLVIAMCHARLLASDGYIPKGTEQYSGTSLACRLVIAMCHARLSASDGYIPKGTEQCNGPPYTTYM